MLRKEKFKITPSRRVAITKLARFAGVSLNWKRSPSESFQWDGKDIACAGQDASTIIHDIAHWIVCDPERRSVEDFGLGPGPDSSDQDTIIMLSSLALSDEEEFASALGIWFEKQMGLDWKSTAIYHAWWQCGNIFPLLSETWGDISDIIWHYEKLFRSCSKDSRSNSS